VLLGAGLVLDFSEDRLDDLGALFEGAHDLHIHRVPRDQVDVFYRVRLAGAMVRERA
jgi:hypothetical protein